MTKGRQQSYIPGVRRTLNNHDIRSVVHPVRVSLPAKRKFQLSLEEQAANASDNKRLRMTLDELEEPTAFTEDTLPSDLAKYWGQRYRLFSMFDQGVRMDREGFYSVTPESIAAHIAERCRSDVVVDAFCGVGGNAIQFAFVCEKVIAIDNSPTRLACAAHNAHVYGVADRIEFILADFQAWTEAYLSDPTNDPIDVVFLSPPWGGIEYKTLNSSSPNINSLPGQIPEYSLDSLVPYTGTELFKLASRLTRNLAFFLPKNTSLEELSSLTPEPIEVEEAWLKGKLKALTVYFGKLVNANN